MQDGHRDHQKDEKSFYQPWHEVEYVTKFTQRLGEEMIYFNEHDTIGITEANKLQFYTEQMLDSGFFDKAILIKWETRTRRSTTSALVARQRKPSSNPT